MELQLTSLDRLCASSLPGVLQVEYLPLPWVASFDRMRSSANLLVNPVVVVSQTPAVDWLSVPLLINTRTWEERSERDTQGNFYAQQISGVTPKLRPSVTGLFSKMEKVRYLLRLTDRGGQKWVLGDPDHAFSFQATASLQQDNQYRISFSGRTNTRAAGFVPA
jgi:hypothetical protein